MISNVSGDNSGRAACVARCQGDPHAKRLCISPPCKGGDSMMAPSYMRDHSRIAARANKSAIPKRSLPQSGFPTSQSGESRRAASLAASARRANVRISGARQPIRRRDRGQHPAVSRGLGRPVAVPSSGQAPPVLDEARAGWHSSAVTGPTEEGRRSEHEREETLPPALPGWPEGWEEPSGQALRRRRWSSAQPQSACSP